MRYLLIGTLLLAGCVVEQEPCKPPEKDVVVYEVKDGKTIHRVKLYKDGKKWYESPWASTYYYNPSHYVRNNYPEFTIKEIIEDKNYDSRAYERYYVTIEKDNNDKKN
ncbi:MAG: hypothetical protein DWQ19_12760 [Crenarchaeota archaeon]|nr:MAG: hypothetical protein DWQ19_12760 [Thermoproteota archaeon]